MSEYLCLLAWPCVNGVVNGNLLQGSSCLPCATADGHGKMNCPGAHTDKEAQCLAWGRDSQGVTQGKGW